MSDLLEQLQRDLPDVFTLVICRHAPADRSPSETQDWVCLGPEWDLAGIERFVSSLVEMHRSTVLLRLDGDFPGSDVPGVLTVDAAGDITPSDLCESLSPHLPLCLVLGPDDRPEGLLERLARRSDAPSVELHWSGGSLDSLLALTRAAVDGDDRMLSLQLGLPEVVRGKGRHGILSIPREVKLRLVAEDDFSLSAASAAQSLLQAFRRETPRESFNGLE